MNAVLAALELDVEGGERLHANQVVHHARTVAVVSAIVEALHRTSRVLKGVVPKSR